MIDPNILASLTSKLQDPSFSTIIKSFNQPEHCNKDELQIVVEQTNPNLFTIIDNQNNIINELKDLLSSNGIEIPDLYQIELNTIVLKTLQIESSINYDINSEMFISGLSGKTINESEQNLPSSMVSGLINFNKIDIIKPDSPQYLNFKKFSIKKKSITINIPNIIKSIKVELNHDDFILNYNDEEIIIAFTKIITDTIENSKVFIDLEEILDRLTEENMDTETIIHNNNLIEELKTQLIDNEEEELTPEQEAHNDDINSQIDAFEEDNITIENRNQFIKDELQKITFNSEDIFSIDIKYQKHDDIATQHIESIVTEIAPEIDIDFEYTYNDIPGVILTVDERKKTYSSYSLEFKQNENNQYTGVVISLKKLKRISQQSDINIMIIGD